jgi:hypothetical protein
MILSETKALIEYFNGSAVYSKNTSDGIKRAVVDLMERKGEIQRAGLKLRDLRTVEWEKKKDLLLGAIFPQGKN